MVPEGAGVFPRDPLNKSLRPSHPRNGRMTALSFAVNSTAIDSKYRLVLHPVPWRAGSRDLSRGSLGVTVVIPKAHRPSYVFDNDDETVCSLMKAARKVAGMLDQRREGVGRTGVIFEGYGVDHLHAKLFPMHGTGDGSSFRRIESKGMDRFFERYEGYLSSHDAMRADDDALSAMARRIRGE